MNERRIRSFVVRAGRMTAAQERAMGELWPRFGIEAGESMLDAVATYGRRAPLALEIGFGTGDTLVARAAADPATDFLGIEVHPPGIGRLLLSCRAAGVANVRVIRGDAVEILERRIAPDSLTEVSLLFPDPWPKKRHHKRRLVQGPFVALVASRLVPGGLLRLATDWQPYAEQMLAVCGAEPLLENTAAGGAWAARAADRAPTRFERRGERLGHAVFDLEFRRRTPP